MTDNFSKHFQVKFGLFYKYRDNEDLRELISFYDKLKHIDTLYLFHQDIEVLRKAFKTCFIPVDAAGGIVVNTKNEFLLIHRKGRWDLPKGKLDKGESFELAAVREVEEECGIQGVEIQHPLISTYHTYPMKNRVALKRTAWYAMIYPGDQLPSPQLEEDITDAVWVAEENLPRYLDDTYPAIHDVFTYYGI